MNGGVIRGEDEETGAVPGRPESVGVDRVGGAGVPEGGGGLMEVSESFGVGGKGKAGGAVDDGDVAACEGAEGTIEEL